MPPENLHRVPEKLSNDRAVFTEPLAAAFQISRQIDISSHRKSVVVGDGRLAFLVAQVLQLLGTEVMVVGKHATKLAAFERLGLPTIELGSGNTSRDYSLAVDCTGSITGIPTALAFLKPRGTLVLKTTVGDPHGPCLAQIVIDEIMLVGSRCGPFDLALNALGRGEIETESLITARYPVEEAVQALKAAAEPDHRKVLLDF